MRNMVAGATGIDVFLLVIAADDGVMPQTREHMAIIDMLEIPMGIVAITKTDLVDEEMVELVQADVEDFLAGTPYGDAPVVAVSSKTGEGLPQLLGLLEDAADKAEGHSAEGPARLPVDRVFTLRGIGTVVTGTLWSGRICTDDSIRLLPDDIEGRARSVQVHDQEVDCAFAGSRVAVNISGIGKEKLRRGQMITKDDYTPTYMVDARINLLDSAPAALKYGAQVRFHHGTADATAKLMFTDRESLTPGDSCYAQIRLKTKIVPAKRDRFILRSLTPVTTIGGGLVIDPHPHKHGMGEEHGQRLETLEKGNPEEVINLLLAEAAPHGMLKDEIEVRSSLPSKQLDKALAETENATAVQSQAGILYYSPAAVTDFNKNVIAALKKKQKQSPADPSLSVEELAKGTGLVVSNRDFQVLLARLIDSGEVASKQQRYSLASAEAKLSGEQKKILEKIEAGLVEGGLAPPSTAELAKTASAGNKDFKLLLKIMEENRSAVKIKPDLYYAPGPLEQAKQELIAHCRENEQITLAEFRDLLGISRKYAQALLEYFDRTGITRRQEDYRVLRKKAGG